MANVQYLYLKKNVEVMTLTILKMQDTFSVFKI